MGEWSRNYLCDFISHLLAQQTWFIHICFEIGGRLREFDLQKNQQLKPVSNGEIRTSSLEKICQIMFLERGVPWINACPYTKSFLGRALNSWLECLKNNMQIHLENVGLISSKGGISNGCLASRIFFKSRALNASLLKAVRWICNGGVTFYFRQLFVMCNGNLNFVRHHAVLWHLSKLLVNQVSNLG